MMHDCLEQGAEFLVEGSLSGCAHEFVDQLATLEEKDGGNVANAKLDSNIVVLVDIALAYNDTSVVVGSQFADDGTHHAARTAPRCPEVYNQRQLAIAIALKVLVGDCYFHFFQV